MKGKIKKIILDKSSVRFVLVGGCCTLIDFAIYMLLVDRIGAIWGKGISMGCAMIVNYFLNKFWSFSANNTKAAPELVRYVCAQAVNITVNVSVNAISLKLLGVKSIAFILATGIAMTVNYLLQRFWVFKKKEQQ